MKDRKTSDEKPGDEAEAVDFVEAVQAEATEQSEATATTEAVGADEPRPARSFLPATPVGRSRLAAAGIAGAFLLGGGLGGYAIGQASDGPDHGDSSRHAGFESNASGPGGGFGGARGHQG